MRTRAMRCLGHLTDTESLNLHDSLGKVCLSSPLPDKKTNQGGQSISSIVQLPHLLSSLFRSQNQRPALTTIGPTASAGT